MSGFAPEGADGSGVTALRTLIERGRQLTTASSPHELARWRATALCVLDTLTTNPVFDLPCSEWVLSSAQDAELEFARGWGSLLGALEGSSSVRPGSSTFLSRVSLPWSACRWSGELLRAGPSPTNGKRATARSVFFCSARFRSSTLREQGRAASVTR